MLTIVKLSKVDLESAENDLKSINGQLQLNQSQLESLVSYQNEYLDKLKNSTTTTLQEINSTQAFLKKLNQAIEHQKSEIANVEEIIEKAKEFWIEKRVRTKSLEGLYKKIEHNQQVKLDREEQKMMDDLVVNNFILNKKRNN